MNDNKKSLLEKIQTQTRIESTYINEELHTQHYQFAHRLIPYIIDKRFDELIHCFSQNTWQD
jgi:hypothetical protein